MDEKKDSGMPTIGCKPLAKANGLFIEKRKMEVS